MQDGTRTIEKWQLALLKAHAKQSTFFGDASQREIKELAADIKSNGQLTPVEIIRDGTIITGHKRVAAAQLLDWTEIDVWVRDDLEAKGADAVERRLIEDNLNRRQLGPLEMARCYQRLKHLGRPQCVSELSYSENTELRDQIGEQLGVSGRTLDRYQRVLEGTPQEVQDAVADHKLHPSTLAEKVAGLPKVQRDQLAAGAPRAGGIPKAVVRRFLPKRDRRPKHTGDAISAYLHNLKCGLADVEGHGWTASP